MDKECIELCNALNQIDGIKTTGSCSGHGVNDYWIAFQIESYSNFWKLYQLACVNGIDWEIMPSDFNNDLIVPKHFILKSKYKGSEVFNKAQELSREITKIFNRVNIIMDAIHQSTKVLLNGKYVDIDNEMVEVIKELNRLGYETSGCCIGTEDYAWINIQETDENKMVELMEILQGTEYILSKSLYFKDGNIYVQYRLETPNYPDNHNNIKSIKTVNDWANKLKKIKKLQYKKYNYLTLDSLFG